MLQPHQCLASLKIVKFKEEVIYVHDIFENIHHRFLAAIDHLEYHHSSTTNETQNKCNTHDDSPSLFMNESIPLEEQNDVVLDVLWKLKQLSPDEYAQVKCKKRTGFITWILGWGIFSNSCNIKKLKKNIEILYHQNKIQTWQIRVLAKYLNLTRRHVNRHEHMLYELDRKLMIMNKTLQDLLIAFSYMKYEMTILT